MTTKHTPGPWKTIAARMESGDVWFLVKGPKAICNADAALIAAAPELLEALEKLTRAFELPSTCEAAAAVLSIIGPARAAIAKATGKDAP